MILIVTKELVPETSHENKFLIPTLDPKPRSQSQIMLRNISFVDHSLSLIISEQRVCSHMLPYTYLGSTTLLFYVQLLSRCLGHPILVLIHRKQPVAQDPLRHPKVKEQKVVVA